MDGKSNEMLESEGNQNCPIRRPLLCNGFITQSTLRLVFLLNALNGFTCQKVESHLTAKTTKFI